MTKKCSKKEPTNWNESWGEFGLFISCVEIVHIGVEKPIFQSESFDLISFVFYYVNVIVIIGNRFHISATAMWIQNSMSLISMTIHNIRRHFYFHNLTMDKCYCVLLIALSISNIFQKTNGNMKNMNERTGCNICLYLLNIKQATNLNW